MRLIDDQLTFNKSDWETKFANYAIDLIKSRGLKAYFNKDAAAWRFYDNTYDYAFALYEYACEHNLPFKGLVQKNIALPFDLQKFVDNVDASTIPKLRIAILNADMKQYRVYTKEDFMKIKYKYPQIVLLNHWQ